MTYAEKLRAFADYLDEHPKVAEKLQGYHPRASVYCGDWDDFQTVCAGLGGYAKERYGATLEAKHVKRDASDELLYSLDVNVSNVCERVEKKNEDGSPVLVPKREYIETGEMVPEYEWSCPPVWSDK